MMELNKKQIQAEIRQVTLDLTSNKMLSVLETQSLKEKHRYPGT